jgi:hypothetical protein
MHALSNRQVNFILEAVLGNNLGEMQRQPRTQALSTTRLAGGKTLVQAGHMSPRFWEITIGTYGG